MHENEVMNGVKAGHGWRNLSRSNVFKRCRSRSPRLTRDQAQQQDRIAAHPPQTSLTLGGPAVPTVSLGLQGTQTYYTTPTGRDSSSQVVLETPRELGALGGKGYKTK
jgi:hypothetical protein